MKITEFKEGDLIVRTKESEVYSSEPKHTGDPFIFCEISYGKIFMLHFNKYKNYKPELFEENLNKRGEDEWEYYKSPKILFDELMGLLYELEDEAASKENFHRAFLYRNAMRYLSLSKSEKP